MNSATEPFIRGIVICACGSTGRVPESIHRLTRLVEELVTTAEILSMWRLTLNTPGISSISSSALLGCRLWMLSSFHRWVALWKTYSCTTWIHGRHWNNHSAKTGVPLTAALSCYPLQHIRRSPTINVNVLSRLESWLTPTSRTPDHGVSTSINVAMSNVVPVLTTCSFTLMASSSMAQAGLKQSWRARAWNARRHAGRSHHRLGYMHVVQKTSGVAGTDGLLPTHSAWRLELIADVVIIWKHYIARTTCCKS